LTTQRNHVVTAQIRLNRRLGEILSSLGLPVLFVGFVLDRPLVGQRILVGSLLFEASNATFVLMSARTSEPALATGLPFAVAADTEIFVVADAERLPSDTVNWTS